MQLTFVYQVIHERVRKAADYKSVEIWCEEFNATFGYASLRNV